jgi:hypothetical protein
MKTFGCFSRFALLLMLVLAARTARADWGYAYAQIFNAATPSPVIPAAFSLNPYGPTPTVTRLSGAGSYDVVFPNVDMSGWVFLVTPAAGSPNYCYVSGIGEGQPTGGSPSSDVQVSCFSPAGSPADTPFSVLAVSDFNDKNIAFTSTGTFVIRSNGNITTTHVSKGSYQVAFNGLSGNGGIVIVSAFLSNVACNTTGWNAAFVVNVNCYDSSGNLADGDFVIAAVPAGVSPGGLAYTLAAFNGSVFNTQDTYNSAGGGVTISRSSTGNYTATFPNLNATQLPSRSMGIATALNSGPVHCEAGSWEGGSGASMQVNVLCFDNAGNPVDSSFTLLFLPASGYAYATFSNAAAPVFAWANPGAAAPVFTPNSTGNYSVNFPQSGMGFGWSPQVVNYGGNASWCKIKDWITSGPPVVDILCFNPAGMPVNTQFSVLAVSNTNFNNIAFAFADKKSTASYTATQSASYNPAGAITIARTTAGSYGVTFSGLNGDGGTVQVTAVGSDNTSCYSNGWESPNFEANVICTDPSGTQTDSQFVIWVITKGATPPGTAYAWSNAPQPGVPLASYSYSPGAGSLSITRPAQGQYQVTFPGAGCSPSCNEFANSQIHVGNVLVTAESGSAPRCNVVNWNNGQKMGDLAVNVQCHNLTGGLADGTFQVLVFTPIVGPPAQIFSITTTEVARPNTTFPLAVMVFDAASNPVSGVPVTLTAPSTGPGGTFSGGALSITVNTDATGTATAPAFTANSIAGDYSVTASALGLATPALINLTNRGNPTPAALTPQIVGPTSGSGSSETLTLTFTDSNGWQDLDVVNVLINSVLDGRTACYLAYSRTVGVLYLVGDDGSTLLPGLTLGGSGTRSNNQCMVNAAGSSATGSGNILTLTLNLSFKAAFGGTKVVYLAARGVGGANSGWHALGVWQAPFTPSGAIGVVSLTPARGGAQTGTAQTFTATLTDSKGTADFGVVNVLVNDFIDGRQACYLAYSAPSNTLLLVDDGGDAGGPFAGSMVLNGAAATIQNKQCLVNGAASSAAASGNTLTVALNITFKDVFAGDRILYVAGRDGTGGNNTGWQAMGTWTVQ